MAEKLAETWIDHLNQVKDAKRRIDKFHQERKGEKDINKIVEREYAGEMRSELRSTQEQIEKKLKKEIRAFCEGNLEGIKLTELERKVMEERLTTNNYAEIDRRLGLTPTTAFNTYERVMRRMNKVKPLSEQQGKILEMKQKGLKSVDIARILNISVETVRVQCYRLKNMMN